MYITGYFREDIFTRWTIQPTSLRESCSHNTEMNEQVHSTHTQRDTHADHVELWITNLVA